MSLIEIIAMVFMVIGTAFMLISAIGVVRMPDLYLRMSASTKSATLGVGAMLLAAAIYFESFEVATRAIAVILFLLVTAPVAAHKMGRAAYFNGVPLWRGTRYDELKGKYDPATHTLAGASAPLPIAQQTETSRVDKEKLPSKQSADSLD